MGYGAADDWPGLCLFCCYQPLCVVSQHSSFCFIKFPSFTPPPPEPEAAWAQRQASPTPRKKAPKKPKPPVATTAEAPVPAKLPQNASDGSAQVFRVRGSDSGIM